MKFILVNYTLIDTKILTHTILHTKKRLYPNVMMKAQVPYTVATWSRKACQAKKEAFKVVGCQLDDFCSTHFI